MAKSGNTSSFSDGGDLDKKLSAVANYTGDTSNASNIGSTGCGFSLGNIPWGTIGQYMPAIGMLLGNTANQIAYNKTPDYRLPFYDAGSYTSNGFTAGGYKDLPSNASNKIADYLLKQKDIANSNAMFMQQYNLPELVKRLLANQVATDRGDFATGTNDMVGDFYTPYSDYYNNTQNDNFYTRYV